MITNITKASVRNNDTVRIVDRLLRARTYHFYLSNKYMFITFSIQTIEKPVFKIKGKVSQFWALMLGYAQGRNAKPTESNGVNILASSFGAVRLTGPLVGKLRF